MLLRTIVKFTVALALAALVQAAAFAEGSDPAASRITVFYGSLLDTMKQAKQLGLKGRYDKLSPVLAKTYDRPLSPRPSPG
jgi:phospholipid transport system substrate-binding protein